jgi:hypothetical protein
VRTELFPVFPVKSRLLPVRPVTIFLNDDNELRRFRRFVTGVPYKLKRHPEADRVKPTASPAGNRPVRCFFVVAGYGFYFFP